MFYEPDILEIVIRQMPAPGAGAGDGSSLQISAFYILCYGNVSGEHSQRSSPQLGWAGVGGVSNCNTCKYLAGEAEAQFTAS